MTKTFLSVLAIAAFVAAPSFALEVPAVVKDTAIQKAKEAIAPSAAAPVVAKPAVAAPAVTTAAPVAAPSLTDKVTDAVIGKKEATPAVVKPAVPVAAKPAVPAKKVVKAPAKKHAH